MKLRHIAIAAIALMSAPELTSAQAPAAAKPCGPGAVLKVVCDVGKPEDLVQVPGSPWIIAANLATAGKPGSGGLTLVHSRSHTAEKITFQSGRARAPFQACPDALDPVQFSGHGLSIRSAGRGKAVLLVIGHGKREAVEVFDVDNRGAKPIVTWAGCLLAPKGAQMNSVVGLADGRILATEYMRPPATLVDAMAGRNTGAVHSWRPGEAGFSKLPGTELPAPNGIEVTPDGKFLVLALTGTSSIVRFELADTTKPPVTLKTAFRTDNLRWAPDGQLLLAGPGPAAGCEPAPGKACPNAPRVAALDPRTMTFTELLRAPEEPGFPGLSSALVVGKTLWLGSYQADRVAYVELPK